MSQRDWVEVQNNIENKSSGLFEKFLILDENFLPNNSLLNPFNAEHSNFSASALGRGNRGSGFPYITSKIFPIISVETK